MLSSATRIVHENFFSFLRVNLVITISFLLVLFISLFNWGVQIETISPAFLAKFSFLKILGLQSLLHFLMLLLFWVFISWLRSTYLLIISNFFRFHKSFEPLIFGLKKTVSFMMIESMQLVVFLIGIILPPLLPAFSTRYFLSSAVMADQDASATNSMFESAKYMKGEFFLMIRLVFFITCFTLSAIALSLFISSFFIKDTLIFCAFNFFIFSFLLLPIHNCYRILLYKKLEHLASDLRFNISFVAKLWFVFSRVFILALLVINVFLIITDGFGDAADQLIFFAQQVYERIF